MLAHFAEVLGALEAEGCGGEISLCLGYHLVLEHVTESARAHSDYRDSVREYSS